LRFYPYHLWAAPPGRMLSETVASHLQRARVVGFGSRDAAADYELLGQVTALEEKDVTEEDWRAHLAMRFQLVETRTGRVVWEHAFDEEKKVAERKPRAVVAAMDAILDEQLEGLTAALDGYLASVEQARGVPVGDAREDAP
ncbi:MAG: membrane integrity-associated transporter subunit PqiC, partial [Myxococcales bacterium]|nr:membrane integrity-associated transporter subunit PqiC [Myxococcales bacterium]